jgi:hypothetical protein
MTQNGEFGVGVGVGTAAEDEPITGVDDTTGVDELAAGILELARGTTADEDTEEATTDEDTEEATTEEETEAATEEEAEDAMELDETAAAQSRGENNNEGFPCLRAVMPNSSIALAVKKQVPA